MIFSFCSVRPSGSESLPGVEGRDPETFEDVSTCGVTDFPVMDTIPEHTTVESMYYFFTFSWLDIIA